MLVDLLVKDTEALLIEPEYTVKSYLFVSYFY